MLDPAAENGAVAEEEGAENENAGADEVIILADEDAVRLRRGSAEDEGAVDDGDEAGGRAKDDDVCAEVGAVVVEVAGNANVVFVPGVGEEEGAAKEALEEAKEATTVDVAGVVAETPLVPPGAAGGLETGANEKALADPERGAGALNENSAAEDAVDTAAVDAAPVVENSDTVEEAEEFAGVLAGA